jgi:hypothetical protein
MSDYQDTVLDFVKSQDDLEFALGDTIDIKTSIVLVVIAFLATQSIGFLKGNPSIDPPWRWVQVFSVLLLVIAGLLALFELLPRKYAARMAPSDFLAWIAELEEFYKGDIEGESKILTQINKTETEKIKARFAQNNGTNALKSKLLKWCFRCLLVALMLNLLTVFGLYLGL